MTENVRSNIKHLRFKISSFLLFSKRNHAPTGIQNSKGISNNVIILTTSWETMDIDRIIAKYPF